MAIEVPFCTSSSGREPVFPSMMGDTRHFDSALDVLYVDISITKG